MASKEVKDISGKVGGVVGKISGIAGPSAVAAVGAFVGSVAIYQGFQDTAGAELAKQIALGGLGLTVTSLVSALSGKDAKNPIELIKGLKSADPSKVLQKTGQLYAKDPSKANAYIEDKLKKMSVTQRTAFSEYVRHDSKMSQLRSTSPTKEQAQVSKGRDVFRSVTMGISMPRQRYGSGLDRG